MSALQTPAEKPHSVSNRSERQEEGGRGTEKPKRNYALRKPMPLDCAARSSYFFVWPAILRIAKGNKCLGR